MSAIDDLPPDDQVTFAIGAVARAHEFLERHVLQLWIFLAGQGVAAYGAPNRFLDRLSGARAMLPHAGHAEDVTALGFDAMNDAKSAHDLRTELVHGVWDSPDPDGIGPFYRFAEKPGHPARQVAERTLNEFVGAAERITRAQFRVGGLFLLGSQGSDRFVRPGDEGYDQHLDLLAGRFDVKHRQIATTWDEDDPRRAAQQAAPQ
jgi:hypothetical protein